MKLSHIAQTIGALFPVSEDREIKGISSPLMAGEDFITFLSNPKYLDSIQTSRATAVITKKGGSQNISGKICLEVDDPYLGYALVAQLFEDKTPVFGQGVHSTAVVDPTSSIHPTVSVGPLTVIGANVTVGPHTRIGASCVIEKDCLIGENSRIDSSVTIRYGSVIKDRVVIQSGAVIGSDGFGNALSKSKFIRIPCFGNVVVGNDVEIGAGTTIDRGNFESTMIGNGTKLDNLIHVAHNVSIGDDCAMAAQTGISGSTKIGNRVIVGGQAGFVGHIEIGDDTFIGAKSGVSKSVESGAKITGYPARDFMTMRRIEASQGTLPSLLKEIKHLKADIENLKILNPEN